MKFTLVADSDFDFSLNDTKRRQQAHDFQQFEAWLRQRGLDHAADDMQAAAGEAQDA